MQELEVMLMIVFQFGISDKSFIGIIWCELRGKRDLTQFVIHQVHNLETLHV